MKKILFSLLPVLAVCLISCEKSDVNSELSGDDIIQFEDANFLLALLEKKTTARFVPGSGWYVYFMDVDTNEDGQISVNEANRHSTISLTKSNISSMPEIKYFISLTTLYCDDNQLSSLDVSNSPFLVYLTCRSNQLTSLDVSNNSKLYSLYCNYNQLTSLDLRNNSELSTLYCYNNQLTSLDLRNNLDLSILECSNNSLTKVILNENHKVGSDYIQAIIDEYGDIIEYVE